MEWPQGCASWGKEHAGPLHQGREGTRGRNEAELAKRWRARAQVQAYRLEQRLASFFTTPEQDAYLLSKTGPAALSAIPRQIVTFRMLRKRALQVLHNPTRNLNAIILSPALPSQSGASACVLFCVFFCTAEALPWEHAARDADIACELRVVRMGVISASVPLLQAMAEEIKARAAKARDGGEVAGGAGGGWGGGAAGDSQMSCSDTADMASRSDSAASDGTSAEKAEL